MSRYFLVAIAFFVALSASALDPSRALTQYVHERWGTDVGLPQMTVEAIAQTPDGYLWLGTEEGLARFDGVRFAVFNRRNVAALRSNVVLALLADRAGNLWIGTHGGGLVRYRDGEFIALTTADGLPTDYVYSLFEDRDGTVWIGARGGLSMFRNGKLTRYRQGGVVGGTIWSIAQERSGAMLFGSDLLGLTRVANGVVTRWTTRNGLPYNAVSAIRCLRDGRVLIGTNGAGLYELRDDRFVPFAVQGALPDLSVDAIYEDARGNLWIGTESGVVRKANGVFTTSPSEGLAQTEIEALFEDREGNLWIGTESNGLHRLRDGKVLTVTKTEGLPSDVTRVILHDRDGSTWVGTRDGLAHISRGVTRTFTTRDGLPTSSVRALFQSSDGTVWIGGEAGAVSQWNGTSLRTTMLNPEVPDNAVRAFAEANGGVWVGTNGGPLTRFENGVVVQRALPLTGSGFFVRALAAQPDGVVWIATDGNGLMQLVDGNVQEVYDERDGLSTDSLRALYLDAEGTLWIGTAGHGLNRLKNGTITTYGTEIGLFDDLVLQILEGEDGRLWMSCNNGVFAVSRQQLDAYAEHHISRIDSFSLDDRDGMKSRDCSGGSQPAGAKSEDGRLWFPTSAGVVIVDPHRIPRSRQIPPVHIEGVTAERQMIPGPHRFALPKGTKHFEIAYAALTFTIPERDRFKYKLEGYDEDWIDAGPRRAAYYTGVPPGTYRFRVIAANGDGVWNEQGDAATITLLPYFHETHAFLALITAAIATLLWAAMALRIRAVRRAAAREAELARQMIGVQRLEALGMLATGIAHDFNNTLMSALPWAEVARKRYPNDALVQRAAANIVQAIDRAKKVTRQLLDFAQPRTPEAVRFDLAQLARDEVSMARAVIPPGIEIETHIDAARSMTIGDKTQIGQVLMNLMLNARDAMPHGGRLCVEVRVPTDGECAKWQLARDFYVLCAVTDTGSGIPNEILHRIFDPFFTTKELGKGTGLGLSVVARIVRDHRGSIHVDSTVGRGTTFFVVLPRALAEAAAPPPRVAEETAAPARAAHVLIVDDETAVAEGICMLLESEGMSVVLAGTGAEALRRIDEGFHPHIVILDLGLPGMSGDLVCAEIRSRMPGVPVIISSGYGDPERLDPLLRDPHTSYLQKPYSIDALLKHIHERLEHAA